MPKPPSLTARQVLAKIEAQEYRCAISGRELTPATATLDHIVPLGRGGKHCIDNVWVVHGQVNAAKGTMLMDEFVALCQDVARHQAALQEVGEPDASKKEPPVITGGEVGHP